MFQSSLIIVFQVWSHVSEVTQQSSPCFVSPGLKSKSLTQSRKPQNSHVSVKLCLLELTIHSSRVMVEYKNV